MFTTLWARRDSHKAEHNCWGE